MVSQRVGNCTYKSYTGFFKNYFLRQKDETAAGRKMNFKRTVVYLQSFMLERYLLLWLEKNRVEEGEIPRKTLHMETLLLEVGAQNLAYKSEKFVSSAGPTYPTLDQHMMRTLQKVETSLGEFYELVKHKTADEEIGKGSLAGALVAASGSEARKPELATGPESIHADRVWYKYPESKYPAPSIQAVSEPLADESISASGDREWGRTYAGSAEYWYVRDDPGPLGDSMWEKEATEEHE